MLQLRLKYENDQGPSCEVFTAHWWWCVLVSWDVSQLVLTVQLCGHTPPLSVVVQCVYGPRPAQRQKRPSAGPDRRRLCGSALVPAPPFIMLTTASGPAQTRPAWSQPQDWPEPGRKTLSLQGQRGTGGWEVEQGGTDSAGRQIGGRWAEKCVFSVNFQTVSLSEHKLPI